MVWKESWKLSLQGSISALKLALLAYMQTFPSVWLTSGLDKKGSPCKIHLQYCIQLWCP